MQQGIVFKGLWYLLFAHLFIWGFLPGLLVESLPLDVVEGAYWGGEWQWGYYKHPPFPAWVLHLFQSSLGDIGPFFLSQICIALTLFCVWQIGRRSLAPEQSAFAVLALMGVYYFTWPTMEFNHNIAQMPIWAAAVWLFYRAVNDWRYADWLLLGLVAGLGLLTKYSILVLLAAMFLWMVWRPELRKGLLRPQLWSGVLVMALVFLPHLLWLVQHDFLPFTYFEDRTVSAAEDGSRIFGPLRFLLVQLVDHLPLLLLLMMAGFWRRGCWQKPAAGTAFIWFMGLAPALLTLVGAILTGAGMRDMWGTPMWNLSGLILASMIPADLLRQRQRRLVVLFGGFLLLLAVLMLLFVGFKDQIRNKPSRTGWPDQALAQSLSSEWSKHSGCPLKLVAGDYWLAELIALELPGASAVPDADLKLAPWVDQRRVEAQGMIELVGGDQPRWGDTLAELGAWAAEGQLSVPWPRLPDHEPLRLSWRLWLPESDCPQ
ncbi:glycosyltransferase family 39 protein [Marinobacterium mangrovicola]|uniref:4-amino-4-deoxy-L-arabinose transferase-like glycosyltransferase n=1 Tax=Marinobacterium mangrovicola TaxID=1476959 RepID=A0A4R1H4A5_9GAMM|nr:glycosyltransferase family 39 protein [Marinobacterium mangrovicola]TCK16497.1 4-amino-4-deoxy-L-arabinose transferase-like glycosyltransferase [Marinobacterium mangrovicola]